MSAPELKPCPFCGMRGSVYRDHCHDESGIFISVRCNSCGSKSGERYFSYGNDCPQTYQEAHDAWNTRVDLHTAVVAERDALRVALIAAKETLAFEVEYHEQGMGCGIEDRNITDRYDAMYFGWESAIERVYSEVINATVEDIDAALSGSAP